MRFSGTQGRYFYWYRPLFVSYALLQEPGRKGRDTMKIKMRYENAYQTIEVETQELEEWLNISISVDESKEAYEKRLQQEIEVQFNRPDYNNWHQHNRHSGNSKAEPNEETGELDTSEPLMEEVINPPIFYKDTIEHENRWGHESVCRALHEVLKPKAVEMVMAIIFEGHSVESYAKKIGDKPNNVSHRYRRAINKLKEYFRETSF